MDKLYQHSPQVSYEPKPKWTKRQILSYTIAGLFIAVGVVGTIVLVLSKLPKPAGADIGNQNSSMLADDTPFPGTENSQSSNSNPNFGTGTDISQASTSADTSFADNGNGSPVTSESKPESGASSKPESSKSSSNSKPASSSGTSANSKPASASGASSSNSKSASSSGTSSNSKPASASVNPANAGTKSGASSNPNPAPSSGTPPNLGTTNSTTSSGQSQPVNAANSQSKAGAKKLPYGIRGDFESLHAPIKMGSTKGFVPPLPVSPPIQYRGGPVMEDAIKVHVLYYGEFSDSSKNLLTTFINGLGQSQWWKSNAMYTGPTKKPLSSNIRLGQVIQQPAVVKRITDDDIYNFIRNSSWTLSKSDIYMLISDETVHETSGLCELYCGWHTYYKRVKSTYKFAYVGSPKRCPQGCSPLTQATAPNNDFEMDSMISIIAHEIAEAASDPELNAWLDSDGLENADKCIWEYGNVTQSADGRFSNEVVGNLNYLVQMNLDPINQYCVN